MTDAQFLVDQLVNAADEMTEAEFVEHIADQTNFTQDDVEIVWAAWWHLDGKTRFEASLWDDAEWQDWLESTLGTFL